MGITSSISRNNDEMVDNLINTRALKSKKIELVFRLVDRGNFFHPAEQSQRGYNDNAYRENYGDAVGHFHLSAPSIYAMALENLDLQDGMSFLNIGSGTGYFSSMAGFLIGERGVSHGVELYEHLVQYAEDRALEMSNSAAAYAYSWCLPQYVHGNALQLRTKRRYDRIYCGALVPQTRRSFFCDMLNVNGVMIMPYGECLLRIQRSSETTFIVKSISNVTFGALIPPNPDNRLTDHEIVIDSYVPPTLVAICRYTVRSHLRRIVAANGGPPVMRHLIKTGDKQFEAGADTRQRIEQNQDEEISANSTQTRHSEMGHTNVRLQNLVHILDDRLIRHREVMARVVPPDNDNARGANEQRRNLLELQRERERKKGDEKMLLDNDEFELIKGFRFERMVGSAVMEDGFNDTDDEDAAWQGPHGGLRDSSSDSSDNDDDYRHDNILPMVRPPVFLGPSSYFVTSTTSSLLNRESLSSRAVNSGGGNASTSQRSANSVRHRRHSDDVYPFNQLRCEMQGESLVIRLSMNRARSSQQNDEHRSNDADNEQSSSTEEHAPVNLDNALADSTPNTSSGYRGGKRSGTSENPGTSKRIRSTYAENSAGEESCKISDHYCETNENDTAKILQDGIGHALDIPHDGEEIDPLNTEEDVDSNIDSAVQPSDIDSFSAGLNQSSARNNTYEETQSPTSLADPALCNVSANATNINSDDLHETNEALNAAEAYRRGLVFGSSSSIRRLRLSHPMADNPYATPATSSAAANNERTSHGNVRSFISPPTVTRVRPDSDAEMDDSDREDQERATAVERQIASLNDFRQHFESRIEALPITKHLISFLKYKYK